MNLNGPRGKGVRRKVSGYPKLPDNWMDFLRDSMNKTKLCYSQGCTVQLVIPANAGQVVVSIGESIPVQNSRPNHEKEDTRIVVHVLHALKQGKQTILVSSTQMPQLSLLAYSMIWLRLNIWATSEWPLA